MKDVYMEEWDFPYVLPPSSARKSEIFAEQIKLTKSEVLFQCGSELNTQRHVSPIKPDVFNCEGRTGRELNTEERRKIHTKLPNIHVEIGDNIYDSSSLP